jgi:cyanophycinase
MESRERSEPPEIARPDFFPYREGVGTLLIIGGSVTPQVVYDEFFRLAGGTKARVVHIPSATRYFEEITDRREYYDEFYSKNPASFDFLHTYDRDTAQRPEFATPLHDATGVWMGGGDQNRLAYLFLNSEVVRGIHGVLARGGAVGGTSSGAAIVSEIMICRGDEEAEIGQGFSLYPQAIVDPHFSGRERQKRLARAVLEHHSHIGVGVDERTALLIQGERFGLIGLEGRSAYFHFPDPAAGKVYRYRLDSGETAALPVPVLGAPPRILEECLQALRPPVVLTAGELMGASVSGDQ